MFKPDDFYLSEPQILRRLLSLNVKAGEQQTSEQEHRQREMSSRVKRLDFQSVEQARGNHKISLSLEKKCRITVL